MPRANIYLTEETYSIWETIPENERSAWVQEQLLIKEQEEKKQKQTTYAKAD